MAEGVADGHAPDGDGDGDGCQAAAARQEPDGGGDGRKLPGRPSSQRRLRLVAIVLPDLEVGKRLFRLPQAGGDCTAGSRGRQAPFPSSTVRFAARLRSSTCLRSSPLSASPFVFQEPFKLAAARSAMLCTRSTRRSSTNSSSAWRWRSRGSTRSRTRWGHATASSWNASRPTSSRHTLA